MAKVIIYGISDMAKLAYYYLKNDSPHQVVAFSIHKSLLPESKLFLGLPIIIFDDIQKYYSPNSYKFFAPVPSEKMNTIREQIYNSIKIKGFKMISYVSSKCVIYNTEIGENCFIQAGNVIHPFTKIGNNVVLWSGNLVGHHGEIGDHVTFASHVAMAGRCIIGDNSYLGTNSTIRDNLILAKGTLVSLATSITRNTEEWSVYIGNPAKKIGKNISRSILKI